MIVSSHRKEYVNGYALWIHCEGGLKLAKRKYVGQEGSLLCLSSLYDTQFSEFSASEVDKELLREKKETLVMLKKANGNFKKRVLAFLYWFGLSSRPLHLYVQPYHVQASGLFTNKTASLVFPAFRVGGMDVAGLIASTRQFAKSFPRLVYARKNVSAFCVCIQKAELNSTSDRINNNFSKFIQKFIY